MTIWPKYSRAPLMQAVIEFRLQEAISVADFDRLMTKFSQPRWKSDQLLEIELKMQVGQAPAPAQRIAGYRFTSPDADQVITVNRSNYSLTVLPPYPGWEIFVAAFLEHHLTWRSVTGQKPLGRIGVRYINRFDIPCAPGKTIKIEDYMLFRTTEPTILDQPVRGLVMQVNSGIIADRIQVNLSTATVDSPIVNHLGISLDIDLFREGVDVPQTETDIDQLLELIRHRRTEIFEGCITDEMRKVIA